MLSHLTFVSLSFVSGKEVSMSHFVLSQNTHRSVKNNVLSHFGINTLFLPRFHGPVVVVNTYNEDNLGPGIHYIYRRTSREAQCNVSNVRPM